MIITVLRQTSYGNMDAKDHDGLKDGAQEEDKAISSGAGGQGICARARGYTSGGKGGFGEKEKAGEAQTYAGEVIGGNGGRRRPTRIPLHSLRRCSIERGGPACVD